MSLFDINKITIAHISILKASVENNTGIAVLTKGYGFGVESSFLPGVNVEGKKARMLTTFDIQGHSVDKEKLDIHAHFEISFIFDVENLEQLAKPVDDSHDVDDTLILSMSNIAYSTARGIIFTKCQGTALSNFILPIMSNSELSAILFQNPKE